MNFTASKQVLSLFIAATLLISTLESKSIYIGGTNQIDPKAELGSLSNPYQSWVKARQNIESGDTVRLLSGFHEEIVEGIGPADIFSNWTTIEAAPGHSPTLERLPLGRDGSGYKNNDLSPAFIANIRLKGIRISDGIDAYGVGNLEIIECEINRNKPWVGSRDAIEKSAINISHGNNITISNSFITNTAIGISIRASDTQIRGNKIMDITHDGIRVISSRNISISNNEIAGLDDGVEDEDADWSRHCDAIHIFISGSQPITKNENIKITDNYIYNCERHSIQTNNYLPNPEIRNSNLIVENNIFGPTGSRNVNNADPVDGFLFRHNTFLPGETTYSSPVNDSKRIITLTNTDLRVSEESSTVYVYNNILDTVIGYRTDVNFWDNNLFDPQGTKTAYPRNTILTSESQFLSHPDSQLAETIETSLAIDSGVVIEGIEPNNHDFHGNERDSIPDIGAYEAPLGQKDRETSDEIAEKLEPVNRLIDDFEDANFSEDPYLSKSNDRGIDWNVDSLSNFEIERTDITRNALTGTPSTAISWITADIPSHWQSYIFDFTAHNSYIKYGTGPVIYADDIDNMIWISLGSESSTLVVRYALEKGKTIDLPNIRLPYFGTEKFRIKAIATKNKVQVEIDVGANSTTDRIVEIPFETLSPLLFTKFGFLEDYPKNNHKTQYDNIQLTNISTPPSEPTYLNISE